jgi:hypothetical protein
MQSSTVALIGAGVAVVGTLGGVIIGQKMTRDAQHRYWLRDNVRQECRELLGQLSVCLFALVDWTRSVRHGRDDAEHAAVTQQYRSSVVDLHRNLGSRFLIAHQIKTAQIKKRWGEARDNYLFDYDDQKLETAYEILVDDIVKIGLQS